MPQTFINQNLYHLFIFFYLSHSTCLVSFYGSFALLLWIIYMLFGEHFHPNQLKVFQRRQEQESKEGHWKIYIYRDHAPFLMSNLMLFKISTNIIWDPKNVKTISLIKKSDILWSSYVMESYIIIQLVRGSFRYAVQTMQTKQITHFLHFLLVPITSKPYLPPTRASHRKVVRPGGNYLSTGASSPVWAIFFFFWLGLHGFNK